MANKILTFLDASVLIYAANKPTAVTLARRMRALQVLGDPDREFLASEYLRLEVLPMAVATTRAEKLLSLRSSSKVPPLWADSSELITLAYDLASRFGLGALGALHVAAATIHNAELVSAEKPSP